jgi:3-oxoacyl-[acyl-carrier protein] reductase
MANRLDGEVALVTGSTRGSGRAIAEMFGREGAAVMVTGRTQELGREVAQVIEKTGGRARYVPMDIEREEDIQRAVAEAVAAFGKLTVLVNNAAPTDLMSTGTVDGILTDLTTERWNRILLGTLTSVFWASKYALVEMLAAGHGSIVNISSASATRGMAGVDAYTAAKAGMLGLTRSVATTYGSQNIRCNALALGMVPHDDSSSGSNGAERSAGLRAVLGKMQLTRLGCPDDIAYAATYLASRESEFLTGAVLPIDGGLTCSVKLDVSETLRQGQS